MKIRSVAVDSAAAGANGVGRTTSMAHISAKQQQRSSHSTMNGEQENGGSTVNKKKKKRKKKKKGGGEEEAAVASEAAPTTVEKNSPETTKKHGDHGVGNSGPLKEQSSPLQPQQQSQGYDEQKEKSSDNSVGNEKDLAKKESAPQQEKPPTQDDSSAPQLRMIPSEEDAAPPKSLAEATVRDPLELSFLTSPGYSPDTTSDTKHGGSTEYSTISSSRELFYEWLDQAFLTAPSSANGGTINGASAQQLEKDWNSFLNFCQERALSEDNTKAIPLADVMELARRIDCRNCREDTLGVIQRFAGGALNAPTDSLQRLVMDPSCLEPNKAPSVDTDVEEAYKYQALEEGHYQTASKSAGDYDNDDDGKNLSFFVTEKPAANRCSEVDSIRGGDGGNIQHKVSRLQLMPVALDATNFETFLRDWLPLGIDENSLVDTSISTDTEEVTREMKGAVGSGSDTVQVSPQFVSECKREVTKQMDGYLDAVSDMADRPMEVQLVSEIENVRHTLAPQQNIHYGAFQVLNNCDKMCDQYIKEHLLDKIMYAEDSFLHESQVDLEMKTWTRFLDVLTDIFMATEDFYKSIEHNFLDQNGVVEPIYLNSELRTKFGEVVEGKTRSATALGTEMKESLKNKSVMKERFTRAIWASAYVGKLDQGKLGALFDLEDEVNELFDLLLEWMHVVHGRRMSSIRREQRTARDQVLDKVEEIVPHLERAYNETETQFSPEQQRHFQTVLATMKLRRGAPLSSQMQIQENVKVFNLVKGVILMWRHVRFMKQRELHSSVPSLPLPLKQFMMDSHDPTDIDALHRDSSCGHGWGGERRVRCIVAGVFYSWLASLCSEWKSECAAQELMADFDLEVTAPASDSGSKPSKKAKKKKKKAVSLQSDSKSISEEGTKSRGAQESLQTKSTEAGAFPPQNDTEASTPKPTTVVKNNVPSTQNGTKRPKEAEKVHQKEADAEASASKSTKSKASTKSKELGSTAKKADGNPKPVSDIKAHTDVDKYASIVVVEDNGVKISAKDFLITRFNDLIKGAAHGDAAVVSVA
ncbi:MAG: hypothetical protein SGILL_001636 [Bacillariaceae sp.]